jgi:hypothetical protein
MTPEEDRAIVEQLISEPLVPTSYTHRQVTALLRDWARDSPPRRFALYETGRDGNGWDGHIFAWGLGFDDHLVVRSLDERLHGRFSSADSMLRTLRRHSDLGLVWIDS